jgi:T5SS/PEP-CTERM-associated repeat protein
LNVEAGGVVSNMLGYLGINVGSSGTATVTGSGSQWNNSGNLYVGGNESAAGGTGSLTITDDGLVDVDGTLKIWDQGTVILDGGSLVTQSFDRTEGGVFNFLSGSLTINDGLQIGSGTIFPGSPTLNSDRRLATAGTTTIAPFRTLTLDGGTLETGDLAINGTLAFNSGTLGITGVGGLTVGAAGPFGMSLSVGSGQNLDVTNTLTVDAGASLSFSTGGNVSAATIANGGVVQGRGNVSAALANQSGGLVRVQVGDLLTFANPTHTNDGDFQLQGGRIDFVGTLTNNAGGNILGRGTLSTTGGLTNLGDLALSNGQTDVFGDVDNQSTGRVIVSGNADVTFWDDVTDSGALFNVSTGSSATFFGTAGFGIAGGGDVFFEADVTPGSSPGLESFGGNVHFGVLANLEIELAGTTKGAEYDALDVVGIASLGGTLDVSLLGVFTPSVGDKFEIVSASGGVSGIFATLAEDLPVLVGGLEWAIDYGANNVVLNVVSAGLAGDYNGNGTVDAADYTVWRNNLGSLAALPNDDTAGVGPDDYVRWKQHYGETATGSGGIAQLATHQVPEPTAGLLLLIAVSLPGRRIRQVGTQPPR